MTCYVSNGTLNSLYLVALVEATQRANFIFSLCLYVYITAGQNDVVSHNTLWRCSPDCRYSFHNGCDVSYFAGSVYTVPNHFLLRRVQTTTDLAGSLPCFNPCGAILSYTLWSAPTGTKILSDH